jgi:hypothetical protein
MTMQLTSRCTEQFLSSFDIDSPEFREAVRIGRSMGMPAPKRERKPKRRTAASLAKAAKEQGVEIIAADGTIFRPAPEIAPDATTERNEWDTVQ